MPESRQELRTKLQKKLRELFQFNASDLDFGIYRILNRKRDEIEDFIEQDLLDAIEEGLKEYSQDDESQLDELKQEIKNTLGEQAFENGGLAEQYENTPLGKKYLQAKKKADKQEVGEEIEKRIYQDLYTFFSRYYDDGDFLTQRRISTRDSKYAIPYNGEEVKLHWANKDQYYIKTGEHFANYKFEANGLNVWFKVQQAEVEKDNVKESDTRYFVPRPDDPIEIDEENDTLTLWFEYRPFKNEEEENRWLEFYNLDRNKSDQRSSLTSQNGREAQCDAYKTFVFKQVQKSLREKLAIKGKNDRILLFNKLNHFTAKNTTDYFIHKNLQDFLERELEYYLKHEVIQVDDFIKADSEQPLQTALTRAKVVRGIAEKVITFLSQIEDFQKKLFEKKKFVVDTHYCVTLDKVPEELYEAILKNEEQLAYWEECYSMGEWEKNLEWNGEWTKAVLESHPYLMLDTKFFEDDFKYELLESFGDLDDKIGGSLINGENYQAINLLKQKYQKDVKCIYIDPPYNSPSSEIIYKNNFKHSSWLSLMENRITLSKSLLRDDAVYVVAIDENEQERLGLTFSELFPNKDRTCVSIIHNPGGIQGSNFSYSHELAYFIYPFENRVIGLENREEDADVRPLRDVSTGSHLREDAANCFYPIYVKDEEIIGFGEVCDDDFHPESANISREDGVLEIYPIDAQGNERKWVFSRQSVESILNELTVEFNSNREIYDIIRRKTHFNYKTVWKHKRYNSNTYGSKLLNNIIPGNEFTFPKSIFNVRDAVHASTHNINDSVVVDYFAGSGTTGHAVLKLNQEFEESDRSYILIEMGKYFKTVLKPRLQKVVFSDEWKDGVPQDKDGQSHAFKYHFIESYEDALNNIDFKDQDDVQQAMEFDDYLLKYMLDFETKGVSATLLKDDAFETPFDYELNIQRGHESPAPEKVDMVETFHYLIGLWVQTLRRYEHQDRKYIISKGEIRDEDAIEDVLVVWRNTEELDLDKEAEWVTEEIIGDHTFDRIYVNGASKVKGYEPTEITFREKMFEGVA